MMLAMSAPAGLPCAVCGTPLPGPAQAPCPRCGLPAAGEASWIVARIGSTITEMTRDRDALLATLRASAPGPPPAPVPYATTPPQYSPPPQYSLPPQPPLPVQPPSSPGRRRLSPQQVLLGLGALLLVAGAAAFVALGWTRLGLAFQATVLLVTTGAACAASGWAARRGLRATEEALAGAGAALLAIVLSAAYAKGLFGIDRLPVRLWAAIACSAAVAITVPLGRLTRTTTTWPLAALLAAQPIALLLLPEHVLSGPAGVAVALAVAVADLVAARALRPALAPVAWVLAGLAALGGSVGGIALAYGRDAVDAWTTCAALAVAAAGAVVLRRLPRQRPLLSGGITLGSFVLDVPLVAFGVVGLAVAGALRTAGNTGPFIGAWIGVALATAGGLLARRVRLAALLMATAIPLAVVSYWFIGGSEEDWQKSLLLAAVTVPAAVWNIDRARRGKQIGSTFLPALVAVVMAGSNGVLSSAVAGLVLALLGAAAFGLAAVRARRPGESALAADGAFALLWIGLFQWHLTEAWGQLGLELAIIGAAAFGYGLAARRRWVSAIAVAVLIAAVWIPLAGAHVTTPEAYSLPAAAGLLVVALPALRRGAASWAAEGGAVAVALVPSAVAVVAQPTALRLVLVVAAAVASVVVGTVRHRQAPFVLGCAVLAYVAIGLLAPYAPLLPRWITLTAAGLVLLLLGATYERRIAQAREAVTWVSRMT